MPNHNFSKLLGKHAQRKAQSRKARLIPDTPVVKVARQIKRYSAVGLCTLGFLIAACSGSGPKDNISVALTDAAPPDQMPEQSGGSFGFSHFVFEQLDGQVVTSLVEGPRGPQVRVSVSFPGLVQIIKSGDPIPDELQMNRPELARLVEQLDSVRTATEKYRDVNAALADGYVQVGGVVPNMGAHFIHEERVNDGVLNVEEPEFVLYDRDQAGQWRLVGTAFVLPREVDPLSAVETAGDDHPEGFEGPLDNWHVHYQLCTLPNGGFRTLSQEACEGRSGIFTVSFGWMIHAWVHDDNPLGVFSVWNPNVPPLALGSRGIRLTRNADRRSIEGTFSLAIENFAHSTIEIKTGEAVSWINADGVSHTVTSSSSGVPDALFDSSLIGPGQTFTRRFDEAGTFAFTCTIHPQMNGTIIVRRPARTGAAPRDSDTHIPA